MVWHERFSRYVQVGIKIACFCMSDCKITKFVCNRVIKSGFVFHFYIFQFRPFEQIYSRIDPPLVLVFLLPKTFWCAIASHAITILRALSLQCCTSFCMVSGGGSYIILLGSTSRLQSGLLIPSLMLPLAEDPLVKQVRNPWKWILQPVRGVPCLP